MMLKIFIGIIILILSYLTFLSFITRHEATKNNNQQQLQPCPDKPNCVLSTSSIKRESIEPLSFINNDPDLSWSSLIQAIIDNNGKIIVDNGHYVHAVFTSTLFRFKDDVEAVMTKEHIDVRSASRAGTSDLGKNRERIESIRKHYNHQNN